MADAATEDAAARLIAAELARAKAEVLRLTALMVSLIGVMELHRPVIDALPNDRVTGYRVACTCGAGQSGWGDATQSLERFNEHRNIEMVMAVGRSYEQQVESSKPASPRSSRMDAE